MEYKLICRICKKEFNSNIDTYNGKSICSKECKDIYKNRIIDSKLFPNLLKELKKVSNN